MLLGVAGLTPGDWTTVNQNVASDDADYVRGTIFTR
jgi:hypothetical protein